MNGTYKLFTTGLAGHKEDLMWLNCFFFFALWWHRHATNRCCGHNQPGTTQNSPEQPHSGSAHHLLQTGWAHIARCHISCCCTSLFFHVLPHCVTSFPQNIAFHMAGIKWDDFNYKTKKTNSASTLIWKYQADQNLNTHWIYIFNLLSSILGPAPD